MHDTVPYLGETLHRWRSGQSTFLACPQRGARLMNWSLDLPDGTVRDVVHWPEGASYDRFASVRGGNPILFPFCARSFDQGEIHHWRDADGVRRPMPMHGLARQGRFELERWDDKGFVALFLPDDQARQAYPFEYEFRVAYRFAPLGLSCELQLRNLDTRTLPWSAGHHFYFAVPWEQGRTKADYRIGVAAARRLKQGDRGELKAGPPLPAVDSLANPDWLDTIHTGLNSPTAMIAPEEGVTGAVRVSIGVDGRSVPAPDAAFVTWAETLESPHYCLEPWMGPPNAAETGVGLHRVPPGKSQSFVVDVSLAT